MMAIRNDFAFIIIVMGTLLAAQEISDEEKQQFFQDILKEHNNYREKHGSDPLSLDKEMCKTAKKLVETWIDDPDAMALTSEHETNYFAMKFDCDSVLDPKTIVYTWYQFAKYYDYSTGISSNRFADLFTKIVWKNTTLLGVGMILKNKMLGVVVIYSPAGNQPKQYKSNVIDPRDVALLKKRLIDRTNKLKIQQNDDKRGF